MSNRKSSGKVITQNEAVEAREAFDAQDPQRSGTVAIANLPAALQSMRLIAEPDDVQKYLASVKHDGVSNVSFDLFLSLVSSLRATIKDENELAVAFRLIDKTGDGVLTVDDLRGIVRELDEKFTDQDLREMIDEADQSNSGKVSFADFERILREPKPKK